MKKGHVIFVLLVLFILGLIAVPVFAMRSYGSIEPITSCDPIGNAHPLCGWQNPEDMVALPDGQYVIVSEYGGMNGEQSGTLSLLDLETGARQVLYNGGSTDGGTTDSGSTSSGSDQRTSSWGDPDCVNAPGQEFSPHGIHFSQRADGQMQLLAVQHGGRESVEMFEVTKSPDGWLLAWRGCVIPPEGSSLNDIVATPDGGFLVTHLMTKRRGALGQLFEFIKASLLGSEGSYVLAWQRDEGFVQLAGSQGIMANGIEISPNAETVFVNYSLTGEIRRINRGSAEIEASNTSLPPLDNVTWAPDGRLLVAGALADSMEIMMSCMDLESGTCPGAFAIFAIDPESLESEVIYEGGPNTPSGGGTVGLQVSDGSLLIGTFAGDRIVRVMPQQAATQ